MPSYHLRNGVGPAVKCASDPCSLHGGSDFQAKDAKEAQIIGERLVKSMYDAASSQEGLTAAIASQEAARGKKTSEVFAGPDDGTALEAHFEDMMRRTVETLGVGDQPYASHSFDVQKTFNETLFSETSLMTDSEADSVISGYQGSFVGLRAKAQDLCGVEYDSEPSARQLAAAAIMDRYESRKAAAFDDVSALTDADRKTLRRKAGDVLSGKTDINEGYSEWSKKRADMIGDRLSNGSVTEEERGRLVKERAQCLRDAKRGTVPASVRRRVIQNAWRNASPYARRKAISSMDADVLRYAPPESVARSLRHRSEDQRFAILTSIGERDKNAMSNIVINGGIGKSDAMTWINRHHVTDADGNVDNTNRMLNAYLRSNFTRQGNARYSESAMVRSMARIRKRDNFTDANGEYSPRKQAQALYDIAYGTGARMKNGKRDSGYLPLATRILSHKAIPRKAVVEFVAMSDARGENRLAHSEYNRDYAASHKDKETGDPIYMKRWHAISSFLPRLYGDVEKDARALRANREARGAKA